MVEAALLAVALARRVDERQVARFGVFERAIVAAGEKALFQRDGDRLGKADADEAAGGDGVAGADQATASRAAMVLPPAAACSAFRRVIRSLDIIPPKEAG